jgi:hypothetical protein
LNKKLGVVKVFDAGSLKEQTLLGRIDAGSLKEQTLLGRIDAGSLKGRPGWDEIQIRLRYPH